MVKFIRTTTAVRDDSNYGRELYFCICSICSLRSSQWHMNSPSFSVKFCLFFFFIFDTYPASLYLFHSCSRFLSIFTYIPVWSIHTHIFFSSPDRPPLPWCPPHFIWSSIASISYLRIYFVCSFLSLIVPLLSVFFLVTRYSLQIFFILFFFLFSVIFHTRVHIHL